MSAVQQRLVSQDEDGMRLDRWFAHHFPQLGFGRLQKLIRNGEVKVNKVKVTTSTRLAPGQTVRVPPIDDPETVKPVKVRDEDADFLRDLILYEDDDIYVFNKPSGLAVQGGSGTYRHLDGMLKSLPNKKGEPPRLVHRLDRDTSGCLVVAKTHAAASHFGTVFRSRSARKIYWAVVAGNPHPQQGEISCFLAKQSGMDGGEQVVVVKNGTPGAQHSTSYYSTTDTASRRFAWVTLKPVTGRTHQLRVHMAQLGTPIIGDPRYFNIENWQGAPGLGEGLHLHARRIAFPLRGGKRLDISAPLPPHMRQSFDALGFDPDRYDIQTQGPGGGRMILVMFDMDGTLIDTQALITEHMAATFVGAGMEAPTPEDSRRVIGLSLPVALGRLARSDDEALVTRLVESYRDHYRASVVTDNGREGLFPGALAALERLKLWPDTQLGIATGKGLNGVHRILGLHGIEDFFVTLQTPDHNPSKPHPGMMYRAMSETGASATETVMVGDTTFDIEMGKAAGAKAIAVSWGYHETDELLAAGADLVIDGYEDLDAAIRTVLEMSDA